MSASRGWFPNGFSAEFTSLPETFKVTNQHRGSATCQAKRFSHLASSYSRQE